MSAATTMPIQKLSHLLSETRAILNDYPTIQEQIISAIDLPPYPANTLIETIEYFADGIQVAAWIDGVKTLDIEVPDGLDKLDVIEMAINGELAMVKVGDEIVINRIDDLAKASVDLQEKLAHF